MTPEGKIKSMVKTLLASFDIQPAAKAGKFSHAAGWYFMPGQAGFGVKGIPDFIGHYHNTFWSLETKAPGKKPTGFQHLQIKAIAASGGKVFAVDGEESLKIFEAWLNKI